MTRTGSVIKTGSMTNMGRVEEWESGSDYKVDNDDVTKICSVVGI